MKIIWNKEQESAVEFVNRLMKMTGKNILHIKVNGKMRNVVLRDDNVCYKKRIGSSWYYHFFGIENMEYTESKSNEKLFIEGLNKALKYLNASGLWTNMKRDIEEMLKIGYAESKTRQDLYSTFHMFDIPKIKSISFGNKGLTESNRARITNALRNKEKLSLFVRSGYDLTFEYNPEKNMAWWSEEYKGCGNGHYYLMLDDRHALFCEDD